MNRTEHLLTIAAEECAEVAQRISKSLRFGLAEVQPGQPLTNAERIAGELVDLLAVIGMLEDEGVLDVPRDVVAINRKKDKVRKFMAYAVECGALTPNDIYNSYNPDADPAEKKPWPIGLDAGRMGPVK